MENKNYVQQIMVKLYKSSLTLCLLYHGTNLSLSFLPFVYSIMDTGFGIQYFGSFMQF